MADDEVEDVDVEETEQKSSKHDKQAADLEKVCLIYVQLSR